MSETGESGGAAASASAAPVCADSGLRCPSCEYNLTGITSQHCPECGIVLDYQNLRLFVQPSPVPTWDKAPGGYVVGFVLTCLQTWFMPWRFGATFPRFYRTSSAAGFRWAALIVGVAIYMAMTIPFDIEFALLSLPGALIGMFMCEFLLFAYLDGALANYENFDTKLLTRGVSQSSRGFVGFFRSFVIISALLVAMTFDDGYSVRYFGFSRFALAIALCLGWWYLGLLLALGARFRSVVIISFAIFGIPVIAGISIVIGYTLGFVFGVVLWSLLFGG